MFRISDRRPDLTIRWVGLAIVLLMGMAVDSSTLAQPTSAQRRTPPPSTKAGPGTSKTTKPSTPKAPPAPLVIDSETLPPDYVSPGDKDPLLLIDQPLVTPDELEQLKKEDRKFGPAINKASMDDASKAAIRNGIRYRLAQFCLKENLEPENFKKLTALHVALRRDLNNAGLAAKDLKPDALRENRRFVMQE
ncbi:MAG: hypothetical protein FJ267_11530, partial [Planctomycetes bacterium]|nr:hypothetical protein [Planctomycetota bacterium]